MPKLIGVFSNFKIRFSENDKQYFLNVSAIDSESSEKLFLFFTHIFVVEILLFVSLRVFQSPFSFATFFVNFSSKCFFFHLNLISYILINFPVYVEPA